MSIIAISGFSLYHTLKQSVEQLSKAIDGPFEALNFDQKRKENYKTLYIRLSETLDPQFVLEKLKTFNLPRCNLRAFLPKTVPDLPLASKKVTPAKTKHMLMHMVEKPEDVMVMAHTEIMYEMQYKYTKLNELSKKNGHTLLEEITHTIFERLMLIMDTNPQAASSAFNLTKLYRKSHPHFGDFQLILNTLQRTQESAPQLTEQDICVVNTQPCLINNIPYKKVKGSCNKYTDVIIKKISDHVDQLNCNINDNDTEEEIAKKKVRVELKKLTPYLPTIIREVITDNFVPERSPYHKFRIYGEPFLPPKETMSPFLNRYKPVKISRSDRMYNLLKMYISLGQYASIMAMDGTVVGGAKLVIRPSEQTMYRIPHSFIHEMKAAVTQGYKPGDTTQQQQQQQHQQQQVQENQQEPVEEWNEPWDEEM